MPEHEFAVWAPRPDRVRLDLDGTLHPMVRSDDGWWRTTVDAAPDARYGFVLGDDPKVLPDPRSPRQPEGVHERSQLWQPAADAWSDSEWAGRSIEGAVIYELHIGTFTPAGTLDTGLFLWQNIFGVWPVDGTVTDELRDRLHAYTEKAIREAALHTTWNDPDSDFEAAVHGWIDSVLDGPVAAELTALVARLDQHTRGDALGQKLIALTGPGVPDVYQGTELWEDSLVDPDNRRAVDYRERRTALADGSHPKMRVVTEALKLRRERPDTFLAGGYRPVPADGTAAEHVVAYGRGTDVTVAVSRWTARLTDWGNTSVTLADGSWTDRLSGRMHSGSVPAAELFGDLPVALLVRTDA